MDLDSNPEQAADPNASQADNVDDDRPGAVIDLGDFNYANYIQQYSGFAKVERCYFIAQRAPKLAAVAFNDMVETLKSLKSTTIYKEYVSTLAPQLEIDYEIDTAWVQASDKEAHHRYEKLDRELNLAKTNLNKEAIRAGHIALGDYYIERGEFNSAVKCYMRAREFCKTAALECALFTRVVKAQSLAGTHSAAASHAARVERAAETLPKSVARNSFLAATNAVAALHSSSYRQAARHFANVRLPAQETGDNDNNNNNNNSSSGGDPWLPPSVQASDVALGGVLCGLASLERSAIRSRLLEGEAFGALLAAASHLSLRALLQDYISSRYSSLFERLEQLRPRLELDIHLSKSADALLQSIRRKALTQYASPYSTIDLTRMATSFNTPLAELERELAALIADNLIAARIDSHNKRLIQSRQDERTDTFSSVLSTGDRYAAQTRDMLWRVSLAQAGMVVGRDTSTRSLSPSNRDRPRKHRPNH